MNLDIRKEVIKLFLTNKNIDDKKFHGYMESKNIPVEMAETEVYKILENIFTAGNYRLVDIENIDKKELENGVDVEKEHTRDLIIATKIALDHLAENPDYYKILLNAGL